MLPLGVTSEFAVVTHLAICLIWLFLPNNSVPHVSVIENIHESANAEFKIRERTFE